MSHHRCWPFIVSCLWYFYLCLGHNGARLVVTNHDVDVNYGHKAATAWSLQYQLIKQVLLPH